MTMHGRRLTSITVQETVLFYDSFTDVDGTLLTAHTPDIDIIGGGWIDRGGAGNQYQILGNVAEALTNAAYSYANVGVADCKISTIAAWAVAPGLVDRNGIVFRLVDDLNYYLAGFADDNFRISQVSSGGFIVRASIAIPAPVIGTYYPIEVVVSGDNITATYNSIYTINHTSSAYNTATRFGMRGEVTTNAFDNFKVVAL